MVGTPLFAWDVYTASEEERVEVAKLKCMLEFDRHPGAALEASACAQIVRDEHARREQLMWRKIAFVAIVPVALGWAGALTAARRTRSERDVEAETVPPR